MSTSPLRLTLGSDPEVMLFDTEQNRIVSAIPVLGRDKHDPILLGRDVKLYADNVLTEMSFAPAESTEEIVERFRDAFTRTQARLGPRYRLHPQASHVYDEDQLQDKAAREVGCTPSFNGWANTQNAIADLKESGFRTGSCHLHLGNADCWTQPKGKLMTKTSVLDAIKMLDIYVGTASTIFDRDPTAPARRDLYGRSAEYRRTTYGCEYRCLGNYVLRSPSLIRLAYDLAIHAISHVSNDTVQDVLQAVNPEEVQLAINTSDPALARVVLSQAALPDELMKRVEHEYAPASFEQEWGIAA